MTANSKGNRAAVRVLAEDTHGMPKAGSLETVFEGKLNLGWLQYSSLFQNHLAFASILAGIRPRDASA